MAIIGQYQGQDITSGTDEDVKKQVQTIAGNLASNPAYYSSPKGEELVNTANDDITRLSQPIVPVDSSTKDKTQSGGGLTLSEATEAGGGDLSTFRLNDDGTYAPKPALTPQEQAVNDAKAEYQSFFKSLMQMGFAQVDTSGIASGYDSRIAEMQRTNESRLKAITQTGIRAGSRYTGGAGGVWGSIFSGEEIAGIKRLQSIQAEKMGAIS